MKILPSPMRPVRADSTTAWMTSSARSEAKAALELRPLAEAYLVLGRLDLAADHLDDASKEAVEALKLNPGSRGAQDLRQKIELKTSGKL